MFTRSTRKTLVAAMLLSGCGITSAFAAQPGWYVGATVGQARFDLSKSELDDLAASTFDVFDSSSLDDSSTAFSAFVGFRISPYLAVEAAYTDLGEAEYRADGAIFIPPLVPVTLGVKLNAKGPTLAVIGALPISDSFDVHARGGVFFAKTELKATADVSGGSGSDSVSSNSQDFFYGIGAGYNVGAHWSFTADFQQYKDVGDKDTTGEGDVNVFTVGASYRF
jgi:OmpA-OmpF porin, OOP family